jgi:murein DD-endopeptidase MepM/ murein hydrolase activator NlpD
MKRKHALVFASLGFTGLAMLGSALFLRNKRRNTKVNTRASETGIQTGYFHLDEILVKSGQRVSRGQVIGTMGADPKNGGPRHLHWEVHPYPFPGGKYSRANALNPVPFLESGELLMPVEEWQGRSPVISSAGHWDNPSRPNHAGVDIMFEREETDLQPVGPGEGAKRFVAYKGTRILAAHSGVVTRAGQIGTGGRIWIRREYSV